jgi:hypothetical protein
MSRQVVLRMPKKLFNRLQFASTIANAYPSEVIRLILNERLEHFVENAQVARVARAKEEKKRADFVQEILGLYKRNEALEKMAEALTEIISSCWDFETQGGKQMGEPAKKRLRERIRSLATSMGLSARKRIITK